MNKAKLISNIEKAFGRSSPKDLRITIHSDMGDYPEVRSHFHQRDWWTCDARYLKSQDGAFTFMTDDTKVYFSPAFMIASLVDPETADTVPDSFVSNLSEALLSKYTPQQLDAAIHFLQFFISGEIWVDNGWRRALARAQRIALSNDQPKSPKT